MTCYRAISTKRRYTIAQNTRAKTRYFINTVGTCEVDHIIRRTFFAIYSSYKVAHQHEEMLKKTALSFDFKEISRFVSFLLS